MTKLNQHSSSSYPSNLQWLVETYFSDPQKCIRLKPGEILIREGELNERLFLVLSGVLMGYMKMPGGGQMEAFRVMHHRFVGGPSFFSKSFTSLNTVVAQEESVVAYITQDQKPVFDGVHHSLEEQFMPFMVAELIHRQHRIHKIGLEKEKALKALLRSEKMASLGQISAGIAHELNNAVAVVKRNSDWLCSNFARILQENYPDQSASFQMGMQEGRKISSREARQKTIDIQNRFGVSRDMAFKIARTGVPDDQLKALADADPGRLEQLIFFWEMGATLNDVLVASNHAVHVVKTIKELGAQRSERKPGMDVVECLDEAVTLLASPLRKVTLDMLMAPLPPIVGNKGELVQVFINLMQNACECMASAHTPNPTLQIQSVASDAEIIITIRDNGPGVDPRLLPRIFEPAITSKTGGRTVGLGLGLTIVERLVDSYGGSIRAESQPGDTVFTIRIPFGGDHAKA
ncbi:MAG: cyclic nucleotide-binding domain-containing protein [Candidatus Omnitrophica bacterium]|nr:cyclic nucleotide-binding domain-containing protein [Candidatus Omnitrophota bacterium]